MSTQEHCEPETIRFTADVVCIRDGAVLLIERGWPPHKGRLALPGGHVDGVRPVAHLVHRFHRLVRVLLAGGHVGFVFLLHLLIADHELVRGRGAVVDNERDRLTGCRFDPVGREPHCLGRFDRDRAVR